MQDSEALQLLHTAIAREPSVTSRGFGLNSRTRVVRDGVVPPEVREEQAMLAREPYLRAIGLCAEWLKAHPRPVTRWERDSYVLRHRVEEWAGLSYVPNGCLIISAIALGFRYEKYGPNLVFKRPRRSGKSALVVS